MTPVDQTILHDPDAGLYGDCQRAVIASLLDLPIDSVPNFSAGGAGWLEFNERLSAFLCPFGLAHIELPLEEFNDQCWMERWHGDAWHALYGPSPRGNGVWHAVVGCNGKIAHDPHPSRAGLADSEWTVGLLVRVR